jgi:hypothetical protein
MKFHAATPPPKRSCDDKLFQPAAGDDERLGADSQSVPDRGSLAGFYFRAERTATGHRKPIHR